MYWASFLLFEKIQMSTCWGVQAVGEYEGLETPLSYNAKNVNRNITTNLIKQFVIIYLINMTKKYYNSYMKTKIFKKQLTIKTRFNPANIEDVRAFENACDILKKQGIEFEKGTETTATEFGKKLYFRYSLITDLIIWVILPLIGLIIFI